MPDWLSMIVGGIIGFLSAVLAEPVRAWLFRARIQLAFDPRENSAQGNFAEFDAANSTHRASSKYARISVKNTSRVTAKACRAFLVGISRRDPSGQFQTIHSDPLPLPWAFLGPTPIDIPPGETSFNFDLFRVDQGQDLLRPCSKPEVLAWGQTIYSVAGRYRFSACVMGDNLRPVSLTLEFEWQGRYDSLITDSFANR